ncbi:MAG: glnG4 [Myxococcaceae bacterium]|nr:glnG4 [Myxococcaceae bacterium]
MRAGNPTVLLAEDDDDLRALLTARLQREGLWVVEVEDGFELRDYLELCRPGGDLSEPDLVITDVRMPGETGPEALAHLAFLHAPVMIISGFLGPELRALAGLRGVVAIFEKPLDLDVLMVAIRRLLKN